MRKTQFAEGQFYHIYNRGTDKRKIFLDDADFQRFLLSMELMNDEQNDLMSQWKDFKTANPNADLNSFPRLSLGKRKPLVKLVCFSLLPNHYHFILEQAAEKGIERFMHRIGVGYSMYFNLKHTREGKLFDGAFKAINAGDDRYLKYLYSYIHLNPAKLIDKNWKNSVREDNKEILNFCLLYPNSSIGEYKNSSYKIINPRRFPDYFPSPTSHMKELAEWLQLTP